MKKHVVAPILIVAAVIASLLLIASLPVTDDQSDVVTLSASKVSAPIHLSEAVSAAKLKVGSTLENEASIAESVGTSEPVYVDTPAGVLSTYPVLPEQLYDRNIAAAQNGDVVAQYQIVKALRQCLNIPAQATIATLELQAADDKLLQKLNADAGYCAALFDRVPEAKLNQQYRHWYEQTLLAQNEMALAHHWFEHYQRFSQEQAKALLQNALSSGDDDVFHYIATYVGIFFPHDETLAEVWAYAGCVRSAACNQQQLLRYYQDTFSAVDSEQIIAGAEAILQQLHERKAIDIDP